MFPLYYTGIGKRPLNEDFYFFFQLDDVCVVGVADGVGGNEGGEIASRKAVETFIKSFKQYYNSETISETILKCFYETHDLIIKLTKDDEKVSNMATTLTVACISDSTVNISHVGDSRAYLVRKNGIKQLTDDDTEVNELLTKGLITKTEAINYPRKNILTNAIGIKKDFKVKVTNFELKNSDRLLLSTDGFYSAITKEEIRDFSKKNSEFSNFFFDIVNVAINDKPSDNFTVIAIEI